MTPRLLRNLAISLALIAPALPAAARPEPLEAARDEAARREGRVVIYSVLSTKAAQPLIADFKVLHPGIEVAYDGDMGSNDMDARYRSESAASAATADVVWSSSTDMQMKLVADGFAAEVRSSQASRLPKWAVWHDRAFGTTLEPVVFAFNPQLLPENRVPRDHAALTRWLDRNALAMRGKITGFDIARSGVGLMFALQDQQRLPGLAQLLAGFGKACFAPMAGTGDMLTGISKGQFTFGYNMMGAYAISRGARDLPNLKVVFPADYTIMLTRVAFVSRHARHPNAARLWLDYMLSARGQSVMGNALELYPIRTDVTARFTASGLLARIGKAARPIRLDPALAEALEPGRRNSFVQDWQARIDRAKPAECANFDRP